MKTIISFFLLTSLLFASCGNNQSNEKDKLSDDSAKSDELANPNSCEEYLDKYEKWADNYFELVEKYMKNPLDASLSAEFMKMAEEGSTWMNKWSGELAECASKPKYQKRYDDISEKIEKKFEELGIE